MKAKYVSDANGRYLVLRIDAKRLLKVIRVEDVTKWVCDHEHMTSDCGRCWSCGAVVRRDK